MTRTSAGTKSLDAKYYVSQEIYAQESTRIFGQAWMCVGREEQIAQVGDYILADVNEESLLVVRTRSKKIACYFNVCRHRGTRLLTRDTGTIDRTIRCPYHAWAYDLDGRLIAAPNMADVADFDKCEYPLKAAVTAVWEGFVFVNLSHQPVAFEAAFAPVLTKYDAWRIGQLISVHRIEYEVRANWKMLFQNYNECYHCAHVHPQLTPLSPSQSATNDLLEGPFLGGPMQLSDAAESMTTTGQACGDRLPRLTAEQARQVHYYTLFPTLLLSPHPDFVLSHRIERMSTDRTRVVSEFLFHPDSIEKSEFDPGPAVEFWDRTNRQDWHVCELFQQGVCSRAYEPGPYANQESVLVAFDRHYLKSLDPVVA